MRVFYLVTMLICFGCNDQEAKTTATLDVTRPLQPLTRGASNATNAAQAPDDFLKPAQFKVTKLDTFRIGDAEHLVQLTAAEERKYLQQPIKHSIYTPYHFYSIQENTPARKVITLLAYDGEYKSDLLRLVYDAHNKLLGRQLVAFSATDGEVGDEAYGWFETPSLFRLTEVQQQPERETSDTTEYAIDSVITRYQVRNEQFQQLQQRKFQRHVVVTRASQ
jgi:hypothetical protein